MTPERLRRRFWTVAIMSVVALGVAVLSACSSTREWLGETGGWVPPDAEIVFQDDFDGDELDEKHWNTCHWWSVDGGCTIASNDELQWYQPDNAQLVDGVLRLEAREQSIVGTDGSEFDFTSGMVTTGPPATREQAKFAFQYGGAEVRLKVPEGAEFWPAFWLLPASTESRPEIDVMEIHGDTPRINDVHLHSFDQAGDRLSWGEESDGPDFSAGWHNFAIHWTPEDLIWLVDGVETHRLNADNDDGIVLPSEPLYLVLNLAIDSDPASAPAGSDAFPAAFEIDWVQVWQLPDDRNR